MKKVIVAMVLLASVLIGGTATALTWEWKDADGLGIADRVAIYVAYAGRGCTDIQGAFRIR